MDNINSENVELKASKAKYVGLCRLKTNGKLSPFKKSFNFSFIKYVI
ncbi:hypothetical protein GOY13_00430 [Wolbachia endosymbiont of Cruorifilaria tuberocauda]|nr:hypothetical protein [Wolbachia endosymbiont of Cruorifilaria tuberocauda]QKX01444.1 hypothetical protein GOY13_00430 [Wolbachia endosymbiont of Cruorifilaria tuberocauda]